MTYPCGAEDQPGNDIVFGNGFPTGSGRGRLVPAAIIPPAEEPDAEYKFCAAKVEPAAVRAAA